MSHDGCSGSFDTGKQVIEKLRMMGFYDQYMPVPLLINCKGCNADFEMETFESKCPNCGLIYGVTPCHAFDPNNVMCAGKEE